MNKQHKMTYNGKKYVTKFGGCWTCKGCAFFDISRDPCCGYDESPDERCFATFNKDEKSRIWVEDKSTTKKDDHAWLIEYYDDVAKDWFIWTAKKTRKSARVSSRILVAKTRIRKFVPTQSYIIF